MKCNCGREIDNFIVQTFGHTSQCTHCAGINVACREAAAAIQKIVAELYAWKGEDGMTALATRLKATLKEFNLCS